VRFRAIVSDYDRTLADNGRAEPRTVDALRRARASGRKLVLITGRTLADLKVVFPDFAVFDLIVAENGAWLLDVASGSEDPLCDAPEPRFLRQLKARKVPFAAGKRVIATIQPHEIIIADLIREMNLNLAISMNRESVMVLPQGIDKGTGLKAALARLGIAADEVVGIGDAENDLAFLRICGYSVAVANAIGSLKGEVDMVTKAAFGAGATEIINLVISGAALTQNLPA
jgi:phosphoglycolate phosphatase (TIGR01487 family)